MAIVYTATLVQDGRIYVGITTKSLERRKYMHLHAAKRCRFQHALHKYGESAFVWAVLVEDVDFSAAKMLEQTAIQMFDSFRSGFNSTLGGEGLLGFQGNRGKKRTAESRARLSDALKQSPRVRRHMQVLRQMKIGVPRADATKEKLSLALAGRLQTSLRKLSDAQAKNIMFLKFFGAERRHCAEWFGVTDSTVRTVSRFEGTWKHLRPESFVPTRWPNRDISGKNALVKPSLTRAQQTNAGLLHALGASFASIGAWLGVGAMTIHRAVKALND